MFKKRAIIETVPESEYTDFSDRLKDTVNVKDVALIGGTVVATGAATYVWTMPEPIATEPIQAITEPVNVLADMPPNLIPDNLPPLTSDLLPVTGDVIQTGVIGEASLNMLANVLDPLIQLLVAISFPIASVIMVGGCFFFMIGRSERAWDVIFNAGLGYVLVQMSPLFLNILREVGKAV
ncbi:hypothetical protein CSV75_01860 [Sporosarcina sp. P18a]|uniref:hypothetical protein n=1 Tax=Sporosarcina sp. P18a TaxID=2048259 RepID=UPI000C17028C|nr:hypothetical protein [Sporosarcina sp. P18a]PIC80560.1 hypothetical protein CSV75_01860 [Sporosarcina sp. P18a]